MHGSGLAAPVLLPGTAGLGRMPARMIGPLWLDPPLHRVRGPDGQATLEPKMMLVLVTLAQADGAVVTRQRLFETGWAGTMVGDEALNRAIAGVRKALSIAGGGVSVETIPRTGYRLLVSQTVETEAGSEQCAQLLSPHPDRRQWMLGAAGVLALGGAGCWWLLWPRRAATAHVLDGRKLLEADPALWPDAAARAEQAIALAPDLADAWGLKARALTERLLTSPTGDDPVAIRAQLEEAAERALALAPGQEDARAALAVAEPFFGAWHGCERRVAAVLSDAPGQRQAILYRADLLADCGRLREAGQLLLPLAQGAAPMRMAVRRLMYYLAAMGEAEGVAQWESLAAQHWPADLTFTAARVSTRLHLGAMDQALLLLNDFGDRVRPWFPPGVAEVLRDAAIAMLTGDEAARTAVVARAEQVAATRISAAAQMMPLLSALGAVDAAFRVADAIYLGRGPLELPLTSPNGGGTVQYQQLRRAQPLFAPTAAAMRADARFWPLVDAIGLVTAWRALGVKPDFLGRRPLPALRPARNRLS